MPISTLVLDVDSKALQDYWKVRAMTIGDAPEGQIFDNIMLALLSSRVSKDEWEAVIQLASKRYFEARENKTWLDEESQTCQHDFGPLGTLVRCIKCKAMRNLL